MIAKQRRPRNLDELGMKGNDLSVTGVELLELLEKYQEAGLAWPEDKVEPENKEDYAIEFFRQLPPNMWV